MPSLITPRELPKWVPGKVLSASDALGWKDVGQRTTSERMKEKQPPAVGLLHEGGFLAALHPYLENNSPADEQPSDG
jgi:hypothetical protein